MYFSKRIIVFGMGILLSGGILQAENVYDFLNLPVSSRLSALGGRNVSLTDQDVNLALLNPATLRDEADKSLALNMSTYLAGIKYGSAVYGWKNGIGNWAIGMQYRDYGTFDAFDEYNQAQGTFTAKDMALNIIYSRPLSDKWQIGANLKPIFSAFERYTSYGVAVDMGLNYLDLENGISVGLSVRNIGSELKGYYQDETGNTTGVLPADVLLGISKKLLHAPFRFSMTLHHLQQWNLNFVENSTGQMLYDNTLIMTNVKPVDMIFRHTVFGLEFLPSKSFYLAASYDHRKHQEMVMNGFKSMAGFSFGGGLRVSKFMVGFSASQFQVNNTAYQFSVSTSLNDFK